MKFRLLFRRPQKVPPFLFLGILPPRPLSLSAKLPITLSAPGVWGRVDVEVMDSADEDVRVSSYLRLKRRKTPLGRRGEGSVAEG